MTACVSAFTEVWVQRTASTNREKGLTVTEIMDAVHDGDIHGMYILGENPAMSDPDVEHARDALAKLEHLGGARYLSSPRLRTMQM